MTFHTEQPAGCVRRPAPLWRPAGVVFLAVSLGAVAIGAMPELILPRHRAADMHALPALPMLVAVQAGFIMLLRPLLATPRTPADAPGRLIGRAAAEHVVWLAVSVPLYVVAAWLSDASAWDVLRCTAYLTAVAVAAWALATWVGLGVPAAVTAVALLAAAVALAAPAGCYLAAEFAARPQWLDGALWVTPVTCGWQLAGWSGGLPAAPWWAWALWPTVGLAAALARMLIRPRP